MTSQLMYIAHNLSDICKSLDIYRELLHLSLCFMLPFFYIFIAFKRVVDMSNKHPDGHFNIAPSISVQVRNLDVGYSIL